MLDQALQSRVGSHAVPSPPASILIVHQDRLGDRAVSLPMLRALRAAFANARIEVLARPAGGELLALLLGARYRSGYAVAGGSFLLHNRVLVPPRTRAGIGRLELIRPLLVLARSVASTGNLQPLTTTPSSPGQAEAGSSVPDPLTSLPLGPEQAKPSDVVVIGFHLGHGGEKARKWEPEHWAQLACLLAAEQCQLYVVAGPAEEHLLDEVRATLLSSDEGQAALTRCTLLAPRSLTELADALARIRVLVCADSGPMHVADALGVPLVALFDGEEHRVWGPQGQLAIVLRELQGTRCRFKSSCQTAACIHAIAPHRVAAEVSRLLQALS
jgi:ADP-heptose:LPS heptosyltransferase